MLLPAACGALCYTIGNNILVNAAIARSDTPAITQLYAIVASLIAGGAWGILFYREVWGWLALAWLLMAAWTLAAITLLSVVDEASG